MKRFIGSVLGLSFLIGFISWAEAAINITAALIRNGAVHVQGNKAQRRAAISWEGTALGISTNPSGLFKFDTANRPPDCVGRLKIGTEERDLVISNCTPAPITIIQGRVPRTGQVLCYDTTGAMINCSGTGQDGALQKGVALPAPRFTDNTNGTITDNLTGLIWLKNANCPNAGRPWQTALDDVASLNSTGKMNGNDCGDTSNVGSHQTDWRLPNIRELHSLVDFAFANPAISNAAGTGKGSLNDPFTNLQASFYWSSTTFADFPITAWYVYFGNGLMDGFEKTNFFFVTAVRGDS